MPGTGSFVGVAGEVGVLAAAPGTLPSTAMCGRDAR